MNTDASLSACGAQLCGEISNLLTFYIYILKHVCTESLSTLCLESLKVDAPGVVAQHDDDDQVCLHRNSVEL